MESKHNTTSLKTYLFENLENINQMSQNFSFRKLEKWGQTNQPTDRQDLPITDPLRSLEMSDKLLSFDFLKCGSMERSRCWGKVWEVWLRILIPIRLWCTKTGLNMQFWLFKSTNLINWHLLQEVLIIGMMLTIFKLLARSFYSYLSQSVGLSVCKVENCQKQGFVITNDL